MDLQLVWWPHAKYGYDLVVLKTIINFVLGSPPPGMSWGGPDYQCPYEINGFGPIPARIRGGSFHFPSFGPERTSDDVVVLCFGKGDLMVTARRQTLCSRSECFSEAA